MTVIDLRSDTASNLPPGMLGRSASAAAMMPYEDPSVNRLEAEQ